MRRASPRTVRRASSRSAPLAGRVEDSGTRKELSGRRVNPWVAADDRRARALAKGRRSTMPEDEATEHPQSVRFVYTQAPDYRIAAANGAYGGVTPQGDYLIEFYCERAQSPIVDEHRILPEGRLGEKLEAEGKSRPPQMERFVQFAVLMSPRQAKGLADWILRNLEKRPDAPG